MLSRLRDAGITARHLAWAQDMTDEDREVESAVLPLVPQNIVDVHAHAAQPAGIGRLSAFARTQMRSSFPVWTLTNSRSVTGMMYGDRKVTRLRMAYPYHGIRHARVNAHLLRHRGPHDLVTLCGKPDDERYTRDELMSGDYVALKMYPHYREPAYGLIREFFPPWAMIAAAEAELPVILHVRRPPSIAWQEICEVADAYPQTRIVLAHLARETRISAAAECGFARLAEHPNLAADVSMAVDPNILELALSTLGPDRVMYGSDEPFNLLRYRAVWRNNERVIAPAYPYSWLTQADFREVSEAGAGASLVHWQVLEGITSTVTRMWPESANTHLAAIFGENALRWFDRVRPY